MNVMLESSATPQAPRTATEFIDLLARSGLVSSLEVQALFLESLPDSAMELAQLLRDRELLTDFQAAQLLRGKWRNFVLGHYKVLRPIASGGMGRVLLAQHATMGRLVALKVLAPTTQPDAAAVGRFFREGRALAALDHPNIVRAYDMGQHESLFYLALEYVEGESLGQVVRRRGALPVAEAVAYIHQAALGLAHAHESGWVHRDVKPDNLLLGQAGVVKLLDLGLARSLDSGDELTSLDQGGQIIGTLDYLSPEQIQPRGEAGPPSDAYSLGATLYTLLTGGPPFSEGHAAQKLIWHLVADARPVRSLRSDVPEELATLLQRMLAKSAEDRPALAEVAGRLGGLRGRVVEGDSTPSPVAAVTSEPRSVPSVARRRWPWLLLGAVGGLVCAVLVATLMLIRPNPRETLTPEEAVSRVGAEVVVEMVVQSKGKEKNGQLGFLNSREDFADPLNFTIVIPREVLSPGQSFDEVLNSYWLNRVRVAGTVVKYRGKAQIRVSGLEQIQLLPSADGARGK